MDASVALESRWDLYKVLGERQRLRLLAVTAVEELSIGELAELLHESQPNVSRHLSPLRRLGLLCERKQGTRVFVHLAPGADADPVVADALLAGRRLCEGEGVLARVAALVRRRDLAARAFFAHTQGTHRSAAFPAELAACLATLAPLIPSRDLALDVGTGDGRLLEVLSPVFRRVVGVDREQAQLDLARVRLAHRGYGNVSLVAADVYDGDFASLLAVHGLADGVFASRFLHHVSRPADVVATLATLLRPGGTLIILDYALHQDETLREAQADLWLGFSAGELTRFAERAGLVDIRVTPLPKNHRGNGPDAHLQWHTLAARRRLGVDGRSRQDGE